MTKIGIFLLIFQVVAAAVAGGLEPAEKNHAEPLRIAAFYPKGTGGFFLPGEKILLVLAVGNSSSQAVSGVAEVTLFDYEGKILGTRKETVSEIAAGKKQVLNIEFPNPGRNGYFPVLAKVFAADRLCSENAAGFIVMPETGKRDPFFGLNQNGLNPKLVEAYKRLGIGTLGIGFMPYHVDLLGGGSVEGYLENRRKNRDWVIETEGFEFYGVIGTAFKDRSVATTFSKADPGDQEVRRRIQEDLFPVDEAFLLRTRKLGEAVAERYRNKIGLWLVGEEIDASFNTSPPRGGTASGTLTAYILMAKQLYRGIKQGNPESKVAVLGIAGGDYRNRNTFMLSKIILKDLGNCFDGVFIDAYSGNWNSLRQRVTSPEEGRLRNYLSDSADLAASFGRPRTIINGERGYAANYVESPWSATNRELGDFTARSLIIARTTPCPLYVIFKDISVTNPDLWKRDRERIPGGFWDCGLWRAVYDENEQWAAVPRPMALAVAAATRELAFTTFVDYLEPGNGVQLCVFRTAEGGSVAAVWTTDMPVEMTLELPADTVKTDFQCNQSSAAGKLTLQVSGSPFYLRTGSSVDELKKNLNAAVYPVTIPVVAEGRMTGSQTMLVQVANKTGKRLTGQIRMPDGERKNIAVPAMGNSGVQLKAPRRDGNGQLTLADGRVFEVTLDRETFPAVRLNKEPVFDGSGGWFAPISPIELKTPDHVEPKSALQWELGYFRQDGTDPSVKLHLAWDDENFYIGSKVFDAVHLQRQTGPHIWQDDMLQYAFSTRFDSARTGLARDNSRNNYGPTEFNLGLALTGAGVENYCWGFKNPGPINFKSKVTRKGNYTVYEVAIPWKFLDFKPVPEAGIRFSALVMDSSRPTETQAAYRLEFGGGIAGKKDVSRFKTVILKELP